jgi:hypothetical protein
VPEDNVKDSKLEVEGNNRTIAYSMKLVNGVYSKLIEQFTKQIKDIEIDEYVMGWNDAFNAVVKMIESCKYTKEDYLNLINEGDEADG